MFHSASPLDDVYCVCGSALAIIGGCYNGGTTGPLEYKSGPSSYRNAHVVMHHNGKKMVITRINYRISSTRSSRS